MNSNLRQCHLIRTHYWDVKTGKTVKFDRATSAQVPEETCAKCQEKVQRQIDNRMQRWRT